MPNLASITTFSGLLTFFGTLALLWGRPTVASVLYIIAGAGGAAIFWDRWSQRAGDQVHVMAFLSGPSPTGSETAMLVTHFPLLLIGLALLVFTLRRMRRPEESS
jgi:hypothetical protein